MTQVESTFKSVVMTPHLYNYVVAQAPSPDVVQSRLIARTQELGEFAEMQIAHEQGALLTLLARTVRARLVIEVGTFTGYSTLCLAAGLQPGGRVVTCDVAEQWTSIAREEWQSAGMSECIELALGPASRTLRSLPEDLGADLVFVDADKPGYIDYWECLVPRVRPGGLLVVDNVLYGGRAAEENATGNALAIRAFNSHVREDERVDSVLLPIVDGLTLARKKDRAAGES